jgi:hypothetical protein
MTPAHTIVAQACLGILLDLDENITRDGLEGLSSCQVCCEALGGSCAVRKRVIKRTRWDEKSV